MRDRRMGWGWVVRLDAGEEIVATLAAWAAERDVRSGVISGIGAVGEAELGFFDRATRTYDHRRFTGEHEILSLSGNLSELDGKPFPHLHLILSGPDFACHGGHLFSGLVTVTCEISVITDGGVLVRARRPDLGFNPLEP